jgi:putative Holliday junction resolvase
MARVLAIDYGNRRVGLAVSDPNRIIATRLDTVPTHTLMDFLRNYFNKEQVDLVVIGYPRQMNNEASEIVLQINPFIKRFKQAFPDMSLELADERFTSRMAKRAMIDGGLKKMARRDKAMVDAVSATIILQSYLETMRNMKG